MNRLRLASCLLLVLTCVNVASLSAQYQCGDSVECSGFYCAGSCGCYPSSAYTQWSPECPIGMCVFHLIQNRDGGGDCPWVCGTGYVSYCFGAA
jgi:hypothetical protein